MVILRPGMDWPNGKRFAFTVFDDTDRATLENVPEVYALLADLGLRTTKSVWPIRGTGRAEIPGSTCEDPAYLRWVLSLQKQGFEIGLHNATFHSSPRSETIRALDRFRSLFGHDPYTAANHASNEEAIYWGRARLSGANAFTYDALRGFRGRNQFRGHVVADPLFWGDVCRARIRYLRNFVFRDINTLRRCPQLPYSDPARPFVNLWFASTEGATVDTFCETLSETKQKRLEEQRGACIMYTHFGKGFCEDGRMDPRFRRCMEQLAQRDGWFPTTVELLDYLRNRGGGKPLTNAARSSLERQWLLDQLTSRAQEALHRVRGTPRYAPPQE